MFLRLSATGMLASTLLSAGGSAQTLGDVARAEESRRKTAPAGKVYTNQSLPNAPPATASGPTASPATAASPSEAPAQSAPGAQAPSTATPGTQPGATSKPDAPKKDEAYWRKRIQAARDGLARAESFAEALQSRINALSNDFVNRDDPAQRNVIATDRQKALAELDRVKKEIKDFTKAIADIQQEARREGVPPGWVR